MVVFFWLDKNRKRPDGERIISSLQTYQFLFHHTLKRNLKSTGVHDGMGVEWGGMGVEWGWKGGWNGLKLLGWLGGLNVALAIPFAHILVLTLN